MKQEDIQKALETIAESRINVAGDLVLEKNVEYEVANVETGGIGIQIINGKTVESNKSGNKVGRPKRKEKTSPKPRETMTFTLKNGVLDGQLSVLFGQMVDDGLIEGNEAHFKALFSGKRDEECVLTWTGKFGKSTLVEIFKRFATEEFVTVPKGYTTAAILEGHFKDKNGEWNTGLDKGNAYNYKVLPLLVEYVRLLKMRPGALIH